MIVNSFFDLSKIGFTIFRVVPILTVDLKITKSSFLRNLETSLLVSLIYLVIIFFDLSIGVPTVMM